MIPFKQIPTNIRVPLFFAEVDNSKANTAQVAQRSLIIAPMIAGGSLVPNVPVICQSSTDMRAAAGPGSVLAGVVDAYRANDNTGELWVLPVSDDPQAVKAAGSVAFAGTTTAVGTLVLYIGGRKISTILASGSTAVQTAAAVSAAINAAVGLPVTSAIDGVTNSKINLTARNGGEPGNDIDIRVNYLGATGGEILPAGLGVVITAMAGGAINPTLTTALSNLNDMGFDFIVSAFTDVTSMAAIALVLSDQSGRWSWTKQLYGHCFIARRGTAGTLAAYGSGLNNQHTSCIGYTDSPTPSYKWAAALAGASAVSLRADPGVPLQYLTLAGVMAPPIQSRFDILTRNNTLLYGGISTWTVDAAGNVTLENIITTYVQNAQGEPDNSYLEIETLFVIVFVLRFLRNVVQTKYSRVKLAADGTRVRANSNVVTPSIIRSDIIAAYRELEALGEVQNADAFSAALVVEKDANNPNRVNVLFPGTLINQLRTFALLFQFRLS